MIQTSFFKSKYSILFTLFALCAFNMTAQIEKPPVYIGCEELTINEMNACFNQKLKAAITESFQLPQVVQDEDYKGTVSIVFIVDKSGNFDVLYVNAMYPELETEVRRIFGQLPKIQPATYNGRAIDERFQFNLHVPIGTSPEAALVSEPSKDINEAIDQNKSLYPEFSSELNIPFVHQEYDEIIYGLNTAENTHTASKPYVYNEVRPYIDLESKRNALLRERKTWGGRKLHNEHFALVQGKNYWFNLNPVFDLQVGKDNSDLDYTYNNTRGIQIQGALGKKFSFSTSFYESQGRFAEYVNDYARLKRPNGNAYGLVPGRGRAKQFKENGFDYPVAEAYLSFTPSEFFNFQFGNGKNFIGDGYRSFFLSDVHTPYPFLKISTTFWKIKYTNLWMWMSDVREEATVNGVNLRKYVAMHHLSWNVTKRFNIGLFESVVTSQNSYPNGFDISFFNPIIFYRAIEFSNNSESGNANIGLNMKYRIKDNISVYTQFLIDEMTTSRVFDGTGYWGNKFAWQLGAKYYNAFKVDNLTLQGEFNWTRPYTFSHRDVDTNAGHYNQPISHLWGGNFWEVIGIARYKKDRWFANAKLIVGKKGFDFEDPDSPSYGGDIYRSYDERVSDVGNEVGQGNSTDIFVADFQGGYTVNPATNLQLFGGVTLRNFTPTESGDIISKSDTSWFTIGLRSSLFNWYLDF